MAQGIGVTIKVPPRWGRWVAGFGALPEECMAASEQLYDTALDLYFGGTQEVVHVVSGDLKSTGRVTPMKRSGHTLSGSVEYGGIPGAATGRVVHYAGIENDRGGSHAFMARGWERAEATFNEVMPMTWKAVVGTWK